MVLTKHEVQVDVKRTGKIKIAKTVLDDSVSNTKTSMYSKCKIKAIPTTTKIHRLS